MITFSNFLRNRKWDIWMCLIKFIKFLKPNYLVLIFIIYLCSYILFMYYLFIYVFHSGFERTSKRFKGSFLHISLGIESQQVVKAAKLLLLLEGFEYPCFPKTYMFSWDHIKDRTQWHKYIFLTTAIENSLFYFSILILWPLTCHKSWQT